MTSIGGSTPRAADSPCCVDEHQPVGAAVHPLLLNDVTWPQEPTLSQRVGGCRTSN